MTHDERQNEASDTNAEFPKDELADLLEQSEHGVSKQEQVQIEEQLDSFLHEQKKTEHAERRRLSYHARHKYDKVPFFVATAAIIVAVAAALSITAFFDSEEQGFLTTVSSPESAEALLLAEFRAEAEGRIAAQAEEIALFQDELSRLERERDTAAQQAQAAFHEREAELEARLQTALEAERARLEEAGITGAELDAALAATEAELEVEYSAQLDDLQQEHQEALAEREAEIGALMAAYEAEQLQLAGFALRQEQTAAELAALLERVSDERLFAEKLTDGLQRALSLLEDGEYAELSSVVEELEELLTSEQARELPVTQVRTEVDRSVLSALLRLASAEQSAEQQLQDREELGGAVENAERRVSDLETQLSAAREALARVESERNRFRASASSTEARLSALRSSVQSVQQALSAEAVELGQRPEQRDAILRSLNVRLEVLEALRSDVVQQERPDLDEAFEDYLDTFAQMREREATAETLSRSAQLLDAIVD
ncbi:MAG: hypothetical protein ABR590_09485 [Spirochaetia bacterium]